MRSISCLDINAFLLQNEQIEEFEEHVPNNERAKRLARAIANCDISDSGEIIIFALIATS